ncbi:glycolate oxidase subunit GlcE [Chitinimonas prasina]|uniref:Glycolate oxidase subunit GlcE n=1 Tax=Chitinimonas prasina TaxID=1434937 RepID=A0ABQ5Y8Q7_9NEIS|nr:glycolate oxidase subunit GlcE [Chitinimonas prasina]GLR11315.1 glycolate oxidase subunit GlcE [Chitinimonas prasina]
MLTDLQAQLRQAHAMSVPVRIVGAGSKQGWHAPQQGEALHVGSHVGIIDYAPAERVISARAGTRLAEIQAVLASQGQMLAAEPPDFGGHATLGGALATGWSGPRRPWAGAMRDQLLGVEILNGQGELMRFGGRVMKNVAGFDLTRLMVGANGTLGLITEAHLKVLPLPEVETVRVFELPQADAIALANRLCAAPWPLSGAAWQGGLLRIRLSGNAAAVATAQQQLGGEPDVERHWFARLQAMQLDSFAPPGAEQGLWRLSLPQTCPPLLADYPQLIDWAGGRRWLSAPLDAAHAINTSARSAGGHALLQRSQAGWPTAPRNPTLLALEARIRRALDPRQILNRRQGD